MTSWKEWLAAFRPAYQVDVAKTPPSVPSTVKESIEQFREGKYLSAAIVFAWVGDDRSRWQTLDGSRIHMPGKGFGTVKRVEEFKLWVKFDVAVDEINAGPTDLELIEPSHFQAGRVGGVIFAPGVILDWAHEVALRHKIRSAPKTPSKPQLNASAVAPLPSKSPLRVVKNEMHPPQEARAKPAPASLAPLASRAPAIKAFCQKRGIKSVLHFTRIENLDHILEHGLVSRTQIDEWRSRNGEKFPLVCDKERWDHQRGAICLSISFPNYLVLTVQQQKYGGEWVILQLDAAILWELECAFCPTNAAHSSMIHSPLHERMNAEALEALFLDRSQVLRNTLKIPDHYPTDPQAEVLVLETIPTKYIRILHLQSDLARPKWERTLAARDYSGISLRTANMYFRARHDYKHWQKVESGAMPEPVPFLSDDHLNSL